MRKTSIYILSLLGLILASCNNNTYSNALKEEEKLIENFIKLQGIIVVKDQPTTMEEWKKMSSDSTKVHLVYWQVPDKDNFYFHLMEEGDTTQPALKVKDWVNLQYIQYTLDAYADTIPYADTIRFWNTNDYQGNTPQIQYMVSTECEGWQIALKYMKYSGAQCKIICPSKQGFTEDQTSVTPRGFDMKIKIKRF